jgi:hypothetical protein
MAGRPSTYTPELADSVLEHVSAGGSIRSWSRKRGRPSRTAVLRWALKDEDFSDRLWEAKRLGMLAHADDLPDEARKAVGKDMAGVTAQKLICDVIKWELSKLHPERFGDHVQVTHRGAPRITLYLPDKRRGLTDELGYLEIKSDRASIMIPPQWP